MDSEAFYKLCKQASKHAGELARKLSGALEIYEEQFHSSNDGMPFKAIQTDCQSGNIGIC